MKLKQKPSDFRVRELLRDGVLERSGPHRVYLVTKRKLTSFEAAALLAEAAGVTPSDVSMAGLKDRQGVTSQYMSVQGGRDVRFKQPELTIEPAGFAGEALSSAASRGNAFRIRLRELDAREVERLGANAEDVRLHGLPNYFDEQRFGNLTHGQGWIARDLMLGNMERALHELLCARSVRDDERTASFKSALDRAWGDWTECREIAGRFRSHHSVFGHLKRRPGDFAGAFRFVASRVRLIHLYAFQSHLWNRAVAAYFKARCGASAHVAESIEGPLVFPVGPCEAEPAWKGGFRLPGERLADVLDARQRELLEDVLAQGGMVADQLQVVNVPGFRLKGEERALLVRPHSLRVSAPERTRGGGRGMNVLLSFELPRGAYATLVVRRLLAGRPSQRPNPSRGKGGRPRR